MEEVTRYNNTQNKVSVSDFRSNDPVQRDLAARFARLKRAAKSFWYKNKRSREKLDRIAIEMEEFAKTIHCFKYGPPDMWGGTAALFDTGKDGRYAWVFGDGETVWTNVPDEEFVLLAGTWFLCEFVREIWKAEKEHEQEDVSRGLALERRYMVYWGVGELLRLIYQSKGRDLDSDLRKLGNPKWTEQESAPKPAIRELADLVFSGMARAYEVASKSEAFRHRNWFRDKNSLEGIRSQLKFIRDIKKAQLPDLT